MLSRHRTWPRREARDGLSGEKKRTNVSGVRAEGERETGGGGHTTLKVTKSA